MGYIKMRNRWLQEKSILFLPQQLPVLGTQVNT